jgi:hypothetical protein
MTNADPEPTTVEDTSGKVQLAVLVRAEAILADPTFPSASGHFAGWVQAVKALRGLGHGADSGCPIEDCLGCIALADFVAAFPEEI